MTVDQNICSKQTVARTQEQAPTEDLQTNLEDLADMPAQFKGINTLLLQNRCSLATGLPGGG